MADIDENKINQLIENKLAKSQFNLTRGHYHEHNGIDSPKLNYTSLVNNPNGFIVVATTTGTTAVNVFGAGGATFNATITGVFLISNDTTAGNITLSNNGATVCVIAKGATAGALVGATSLTNTAYSRGNSITVVSSSVGNATVFITYTS